MDLDLPLVAVTLALGCACLWLWKVYRRKAAQAPDIGDLFETEETELFTFSLAEKVTYEKLKTKCLDYSRDIGASISNIIKEDSDAEANPRTTDNGQSVRLAGDVGAKANRVLERALVVRAAECVRQAIPIVRQRESVYKSWKGGLFSESVWLKYLDVMKQVEDEFNEIRTEADAIKPGWSSTVFDDGKREVFVQQRKHEEEEQKKQKEKEEKKAEKAKKNKEKHDALLKVQQEAKQARIAEKMFEELMHDAPQSTVRSSSVDRKKRA